ncbi:MAG: GNAT family N-acetyltransferase [Nocardioides sp.]
MEIREITWDDTDGVRRTSALNEAVRVAEEPWSHPSTPRQVAGEMRYGWDSEPSAHFLAEVGGTDVATAFYETATYDNLHLAWLGVNVHPEHRRQGHGTVVLEHLMDRARGDGKTSVGMSSWDLPGPPAFAARHGFERKLVDVCRRQYLAKLDRDDLDRLHGEALAAAEDYELVRRVGTTPAEELEELAVLTASINDAPLDDLDIEDEEFPPERIAAYEAAQAGQGHLLHRICVRRRDSGELAGHTVVAVESERPWIAHQHDTSVARAHRGHRLGLLLKTDMLRWLVETQPQVESIDTWNAESNDHMIGVNETLGYEVLARSFAYQRSV